MIRSTESQRKPWRYPSRLRARDNGSSEALHHDLSAARREVDDLRGLVAARTAVAETLAALQRANGTLILERTEAAERLQAEVASLV